MDDDSLTSVSPVSSVHEEPVSPLSTGSKGKRPRGHRLSAVSSSSPRSAGRSSRSSRCSSASRGSSAFRKATGKKYSLGTGLEEGAPEDEAEQCTDEDPDALLRRLRDESQLPGLAVLCRLEGLQAVGPSVLLLVAAFCVFLPDSAAMDALCPALYGALALGGMGWLLAESAYRRRAFLRRMGDQVAAVALAKEGDLRGLLSADPRVFYVQSACQRSAIEAAVLSEAAARRAADPLHFVRPELEGLNLSDDGVTIIDTTGVILWISDSMCRVLGYRRDEMVGENIRFLMPQPYSGQHDHFLKRHVTSGVTSVLGGQRMVPILKADGRQEIVLLGVEDRVDPFGSGVRLFVGTMVFDVEDAAVAGFRRAIKYDHMSILEAASALGRKPQPLLAMSITGTVEFMNPPAEALFGWTQEEVLGRNIKMLMGEPFASRHDSFLQKYQDRCLEAERAQGDHVPASNIVGSGRDVVAKHKSGSSLRIFLMVARMDRASGRAADCLFLGHIVPLRNPTEQEKALAQEAAQHREARQQRRRARLAQRNQSADSDTDDDGSELSSAKGLRLLDAGEVAGWTPFRKIGLRKCTVVVADVFGLYQDRPREAATNDYEAFLGLVQDACQQNRGHLQSVVGDRAVVTFNANVPNTSHRSSAITMMLAFTKSWAAMAQTNTWAAFGDGRRMNVAAVSREIPQGLWGKQPILVGEAEDACAALLRAAGEAGATHPIIDQSLHAELQYSFQCRLINHVVLRPGAAQAAVLAAYEVQLQKEVEEDEWMYQIGDGEDTKDDPLAQWKAAWDHLGGEKAVAAGLVGRYGAALECLERYLDEHPSDPVALWLESAVRCRWEEAEQAPALTGQCGRVPFLLQYSAPKAAPEDAAAAAYGTPRAEAGGPNASTASGGGAGYVPRSPAAGRTRVHGPQSRRSMASPGHAARCSSVVSLSSVGSVIHSDLRLFRVLSDNIQMLLASGSDPVVVLDHQETLHYWNARAEQMFGWTAAEAVGQKLDLILPPALRGGRHAAHVARYLAAGRPLDAARMTGVTGVHKSGAEVAVDVAVHVCTSGVAEKTLFVGFFRDRGAAGAPGGAFPAEVAAQLRADPRAVVAARYDCATALFADLAGFPRAAAALEAEAAVRARSLVIAAFDVLCQQHSVTKVKTLGDMYVAVCGAPAAVKGHAEKAVDCALDLIDKGDALGAGDRPLAVRVGVSTGAVVAGVVGGQRRSYDVWGAAVNVASRLMSHGQPRRLQISQSTHERLLNKANYALTPAEVAVEGAAPVRAYFVERKKWAMG